MSDRLPWFRCFPSALLGALAGLQADEGFVYVVALMRIYETGGPVIETARTLARRTGMTERRAAKALEELISLGKLELLPDGRIDAESTHDEIEWQQGMRTNNSTAGKISAAKRAGKSQQNQRTASTTVEQSSNHKRDKSKEESSDTNVSSLSERARKNPWPSDYREQVWALYPKHDEKKDSMTALDAVYRSDKIPFETIIDGIRRLSAHIEDPKFAPALHRWLKKERWNDEMRPRAVQQGPPARRPQQPAIKNPYVASLARSYQDRQESRHEPSDDDLFGPEDAGSHEPRSLDDHIQVQEPARGASRPVPALLNLRVAGPDRH